MDLAKSIFDDVHYQVTDHTAVNETHDSDVALDLPITAVQNEFFWRQFLIPTANRCEYSSAIFSASTILSPHRISKLRCIWVDRRPLHVYESFSAKEYRARSP